MALRETILTVLTRGKMTGYEITRHFDEVLSYFWQASHQQVYRELGRLASDGCVTHKEVVQSGKPNKKVYTITRRGRDELRRWVREPTPLPPQRYDLLVKLLAGPVVEKSDLLTEIRRYKTVTDEIHNNCRKMQDACCGAPQESVSEHDQILYLALRRGVLLIEAQQEWLNEVIDYLENGYIKH